MMLLIQMVEMQDEQNKGCQAEKALLSRLRAYAIISFLTKGYTACKRLAEKLSFS